MPPTSTRGTCIHRVCQQRCRPFRPSRPRSALPLRVSGNCRPVAVAAAGDPYGAGYDSYNDYDDSYGREAIVPAVEDPMKILLEEFDLEVDTLFEKQTPAQPEYQSWESTPLGEDSHGLDQAWMTEEYEEESMLIEAEEEEYDADELHSEQMDFAFEGRQMHQMEQEKAFELHHGQMARSVNPYATTLFYANVLEDMSKIDEAGETSDIPAWIRALYVMERNFDGWNEALREKLLASQVSLSRNYSARKLAEYRESVSELNGDFDYSQLTFATAAAAEEEAAAAEEDISGTGDRLEPLLDVLPGVSGADAAQAAQFAQELLLPGGFGPAAGGPDEGSGSSLDEEEEEEEEDSELDF